MLGKNYPADILDQTTDILAACKQIDPSLNLGSLSQGALAEALANERQRQGQIASLEKQLTELRNQRDEQLIGMWDAIKRVRATVKGVYGDDSSQYELVGGKRLSERKRPVRRQPA
jgi:hypothetical protein